MGIKIFQHQSIPITQDIIAWFRWSIKATINAGPEHHWTCAEQAC